MPLESPAGHVQLIWLIVPRIVGPGWVTARGSNFKSAFLIFRPSRDWSDIRGRMRKRFVGTFWGEEVSYNCELKIMRAEKLLLILIKGDACSWNCFFGNCNLNLGRIKSVEIIDFSIFFIFLVFLMYFE